MDAPMKRVVSRRPASVPLTRGPFVLIGLLLVGGLWGGCTSEHTSSSSPDTTRAADPDTSVAEKDPARTETSSTAASPDAPSGERTLAERLDDARMEARIQQALVQQRSLRVFDLRPSVVDGRVTLQGDVNTRDQYDEAARTARRVEGVEAVTNELTVGGAPVSETEDDEAGDEGSTGPVYHTVQAGESLWRIAQRYDTSVQQLRALNDLRTNGLQPGERIRVR